MFDSMTMHMTVTIVIVAVLLVVLLGGLLAVVRILASRERD